MSLLPAITFLCVGGLAMPIARRAHGDFITPTVFICAVWFGALGLYFLRLLPYPRMNVETLRVDD